MSFCSCDVIFLERNKNKFRSTRTRYVVSAPSANVCLLPENLKHKINLRDMDTKKGTTAACSYVDEGRRKQRSPTYMNRCVRKFFNEWEVKFTVSVELPKRQQTWRLLMQTNTHIFTFGTINHLTLTSLYDIFTIPNDISICYFSSPHLPVSLCRSFLVPLRRSVTMKLSCSSHSLAHWLCLYLCICRAMVSIKKY